MAAFNHHMAADAHGGAAPIAEVDPQYTIATQAFAILGHRLPQGLQQQLNAIHAFRSDAMEAAELDTALAISQLSPLE